MFETVLTYGAGALFFAILLIPLMLRLRTPNEEIVKRLEDDKGDSHLSWESLRDSQDVRASWSRRIASVHLYRRDGQGAASEAEGADQDAYHIVMMDHEERPHEVDMEPTSWGEVSPRARDLAGWLGVPFEDASYGADVHHSDHMVP